MLAAGTSRWGSGGPRCLRHAISQIYPHNPQKEAESYGSFHPAVIEIMSFTSSYALLLGFTFFPNDLIHLGAILVPKMAVAPILSVP